MLIPSRSSTTIRPRKLTILSKNNPVARALVALRSFKRLTRKPFTRTESHNSRRTKGFDIERDPIYGLSYSNVLQMLSVALWVDQAVDFDPFHLRQGLSVLSSYSLLSWDETSRTVSMHPLVHEWARLRMDAKQSEQNWLSSLCILAMATKERYYYQAHFRELRSHIEASVQHDAFSQLTTSFRPLYRLVNTLQFLGSFDLALRSSKVLFNKASESTEVTATNLTYIKQQYAVCLYLCGRFQEAVLPMEEVVEWRRKLPKYHADRLASQHELAGVLMALGQNARALVILEEVVRFEEGLSEDHPDRLTSQHKLARACMALGQNERALMILEEVVRIREGLSEDHPDRLTSQHELARACMALGQNERALVILEEVVRIEEGLSEDHPDRLTSQHELARAYKALGQNERALVILEEVVRTREGLSEDHPSRLSSQHELARAYMALGQNERALMILEEVVRIREGLSEDHPDRLTSQHELARASMALGQNERAVVILEEVVRIRSKVLPTEHGYRVGSEALLKELYRRMGIQ